MGARQPGARPEPTATRVSLVLEAGEVVIEVLEARAPRTAAFFLAHVDAGAYDDTTVYRSTTLGVIGGPRLVQAGPLCDVLAPATPARAPRRLDPPRLADFETSDESGLRHETGTVSLARDLLGSGDAITEIFICLGAFPQLDQGGRTEPDERGFPAFGRVCSGLDVVRAIARGDTTGATSIAMLEGQILSPQIRIERAARS